MWVGLRRDRLRKDADSYRIAERDIFLDQTVLLSKNLSNFIHYRNTKPVIILILCLVQHRQQSAFVPSFRKTRFQLLNTRH